MVYSLKKLAIFSGYVTLVTLSKDIRGLSEQTFYTRRGSVSLIKMDLPISHHQHLKLGIRFQPRNRVPQNQIIQIAIHCYNTPKISRHIWLVVSTLWKILVSWDDYSQYMEKKKMFQTTNQILSFWSWWQISWYPHFWLIQPTSNATPPPEGPAAGRPKQVPCKPEPCRAFSKPLAVNGQQACHSSVRWWRVQRNRCFFSRGFRYLLGDSVICNWYITDKWNINVFIYIYNINIYILTDIIYL